jgi:8-oxo-dGTP pyrophosphatase MutT (NUDIX family)
MENNQASSKEPIRSCGFVVVRRRGGELFFLLLKSSRDGYWGLPKGHMLPGENLLEAAYRELKEETGCESIAVHQGFHETITYQVRKGDALKPKRTDYFLGEISSGRVCLSEEHLEYRWVTLSEAEELLAFENLKDVLRKAHDALITDIEPR